MPWSDLLGEAEELAASGRNTEAFLKAFGALEACYSLELGFREPSEETFDANCKELLKSKKLHQNHYDLANHLRKARNVVVHKYGFEPSNNEVKKAIRTVQHLVGPFVKSVGDVMSKPVRCATLSDRIGEFVRQMREDGISQFPVLDENQRVVGTLDERAVFEAWSIGGGILDPDTKVAKIMHPDCLPEIAATDAIEKARRQLQNSDVSALLILTDRKAIGIITKLDLLRSAEAL